MTGMREIMRELEASGLAATDDSAARRRIIRLIVLIKDIYFAYSATDTRNQFLLFMLLTYRRVVDSHLQGLTAQI